MKQGKMKNTLLLFGGLVAILALIVFPNYAHAHNDVGFQSLTIPAAGDVPPLEAGLWYPTNAEEKPQPLGTFVQNVALDGPIEGRGLPLIVMSHGTGAWFGSHYDTALALARAGFVVIAISHPGDTYNDNRNQLHVELRPIAIQRTIDFMLREWVDRGDLDAQRVGFFGFSTGGFTGLVLIGGNPDLKQILPHCQNHPTFFDCQLQALHRNDKNQVDPAAPIHWVHDTRIRAAVVVAPALGFTFGPSNLRTATLPIQLWRAGDDEILPNPDYAEAVRKALPRPPRYHVIARAGHFDFLAPCNDATAKVVPMICKERNANFDRRKFHDEFNAAVVKFFNAKL